MSGGSYDYAYSHLDIEIQKVHLIPERAAFQSLLKLVKEALHDIEWVDSSDYGNGDELKAINECFQFLTLDSEKLIKAAAYDNLAGILKSYLK